VRPVADDVRVPNRSHFNKRRRQSSFDVLVRQSPLKAGGDFAAGQAVFSAVEWSDQSLLAALDALYLEVLADDLANARRGKRESNEFEFYDSGLMRIVELLRRRCGAPG
jgi:hypothetical protein